jgi:hypothetical protein
MEVHMAEQAAVKKPEEKKADYSRVVFQPRTHPTQTEDVLLTVNGEMLQIKRATKVIVHNSFLEVAQHGVYQQFEQLPGQDRKVVADIMHYPYTVLEEGLTKDDYLKWRRENAATKAE